MEKRALVSVVDDDESVRESLPDLLTEFGFIAKTFKSAQEFLTSEYLGQTKCIILDVAMSEMNGLEMQHELIIRKQKGIPIVFITAHEDRRGSTACSSGERARSRFAQAVQ